MVKRKREAVIIIRGGTWAVAKRVWLNRRESDKRGTKGRIHEGSATNEIPKIRSAVGDQTRNMEKKKKSINAWAEQSIRGQ